MTPQYEIVAAYTRVSTQKQRDEGNGLATQQRECIAYATARGWDIDVWYEDAETGTTLDRARLQDLRKDVREGKVKHIIVDRLDRWAREDLEGEQLYRELAGLGARVHSVKEQFDDSPSGELMRKIMLAFAAYDRKMTLQKLAGGRRTAARTRGTYMGGQGVYGYRPVRDSKGKLEIVPEEAAAIRMLFKLRDEGLSDKKIARALNEAGHRTKLGKHFTAVQIYRIRQREPFYRGVTLLNVSVDQVSDPAHEPILKPAQ